MEIHFYFIFCQFLFHIYLKALLDAYSFMTSYIFLKEVTLFLYYVQVANSTSLVFEDATF